MTAADRFATALAVRGILRGPTRTLTLAPVERSGAEQAANGDTTALLRQALQARRTQRPPQTRW